MKISDKANKLIENLRKFAVQDESGVSATDIMGSLQGYRDKWEWLNDIQEMAE